MTDAELLDYVRDGDLYDRRPDSDRLRFAALASLERGEDERAQVYATLAQAAATAELER